MSGNGKTSQESWVQIFLRTYDKKKSNIYYRIARFALVLSITILTVVFSINADIFKQYSEDYNYYWWWPFHILMFANEQLKLENKPLENKITIKPAGKKSISKYNYWFCNRPNFIDKFDL